MPCRCFLIFLSALLALFYFGCLSSKDEQFYEMMEANMAVAGAFAAKDKECGTGHSVTVPVTGRARKQHVDNCVAQIVALPCSSWVSADPTPSLCLTIQLDY